MTPITTTRHGRTHKLKVGQVSVYVTVNRDAGGPAVSLCVVTL